MPVVFICCHKSGYYQKPMTGMWDHVKTYLDTKLKKSTVPLSKKLSVHRDSFYCGDAAGRTATSDYKKDFAATDRMFAHNCKLTFYTPEKYFLDQKERQWVYPPMIDRESQRLLAHDVECSEKIVDTCCQEGLTVIMPIGYPGSGKSHWYREIQKKLRKKKTRSQRFIRSS